MRSKSNCVSQANRFFALLLAASVSGCLEAPSGRDEYNDHFDIKIGSTVTGIREQTVDNQGRLHLLVDIVHCFKPSQPKLGDSRVLLKNISQVLYVYDADKWDSLPLLSLSTYAGFFNMGTQHFAYRFAKDHLGLPYMITDSKLQPKIFSFAGNRWKGFSLKDNQVDWLGKCIHGFWSASDDFMGLCLEPYQSVFTESDGGTQSKPQSIYLMQAQGAKKLLVGDTSSVSGSHWQYLDMHRFRDTLDYLLAFSPITAQPSFNLNSIWLRMVRQPGGKFTDASCRVLLGKLDSVLPRFDANDSIARILNPHSDQGMNTQSYSQYQWKGDSLVRRDSDLPSPIPNTSRLEVGPDGCLMTRQLQATIQQGRPSTLEENGAYPGDTMDPFVGKKEVTADSFPITFGCVPHTDTLVFASAPGKFLVKQVHARTSGDIYVTDFWQKPDTLDVTSAFSLSDSAILHQIRSRTVIDIRHWKKGVWKKIPVPF
jgi:hypothetical protein